MNEHSNPIEFLIDFALANGADRFVVNNAKDELKKLKEDSQDSNRWLSCEKELYDLKNKIKTIFSKPVAYGLINGRHDLYALNLQNNSHNDQSKVIPLYSDKSEFLSDDWKGYTHSDKFLN